MSPVFTLKGFPMLVLLRQRNYALVWSSSLISQIGTAALLAALPYYVYAISHSVAASGTAVVAELLPGVLFNTIGGLFADRLSRKLALALGNTVRAAIILPLIVVHSPSELWIVYLVGFVNQSVASLIGPFGSAALPHVVGRQDLTTANAALSAASSTALLLGSPLGGLLLQGVGLPAVVIVDAVSFIAPAIAILLVDVPLEDHRHRSVPTGRPVGTLLHDLLLGWRYVLQHPTVARVFLVTGISLLAFGIYQVAFAPFVRHVLHGSPAFYSWSLTLQGLSGIAGALVMGAVARRAGPRALVVGSLFTFGLTGLVEVLAVNKLVTLSISLVYGFPAEFNGASLNALLQASTEDAYRGRVSGAYGTVWSVATLLSATIATATTDLIGIRTILAVAGGLLILAGAAGSLLPTQLPGSAESETLRH
jgi:MFS family permease